MSDLEYATDMWYSDHQYESLCKVYFAYAFTVGNILYQNLFLMYCQHGSYISYCLYVIAHRFTQSYNTVHTHTTHLIPFHTSHTYATQYIFIKYVTWIMWLMQLLYISALSTGSNTHNIIHTISHRSCHFNATSHRFMVMLIWLLMMTTFPMVLSHLRNQASTLMMWKDTVS